MKYFLIYIMIIKDYLNIMIIKPYATGLKQINYDHVHQPF